MDVTIDLNADLGEQDTSELDAGIMPFISSCNIAAGGHAGDEESIKRTIDLALAHEVAVGAHPSFPDKDNFGRIPMLISNDALLEAVREQILLVKRKAEQHGTNLHHVKPHGALYNLMAKDEYLSMIMIEQIQGIDPDLIIYGLAHSKTEEVANAMKHPFVGEGFMDRRYERSRLLRDRKFKDAVLESEEEVVDQVLNLVFRKQVYLGLSTISIEAKTLCLHSDTEGAVNLARVIHQRLLEEGARIASV